MTKRLYHKKKKKNKFTRTRLKKIANMRHKSPRQFWTLFSKKSMKKSNDISMNDFYEYFANMNKHENISENFIDENIINNSDNCIFDALDKQFTLDEIENTVQSLKRNKSFGSDLLFNEYFMETFDILGVHLLDIFNAILDTGIYPEIWTKGTIIPIIKKGDPNVCNYRGITLVSCFSKFLLVFQIIELRL